MEQEKMERLLSVASVFVMNHKELFIEECVTDEIFFGQTREDALVKAENLYSEISDIVMKQLLTL